MSLSKVVASATTYYECRICGTLNGYLLGFDDGGAFGCWTCKAAGLEKGDYARPLAVELGCSTVELIDDPRRWLAPFVTGTASRHEEPEPLPAPEQIAKWQSALNESGRVPAAARRYLNEQRGLNRRTIDRYQLGFDGEAITLPVYEDGELVNVRRRFLARGARPKIRGLRGRGSQLYPSWPRRGPVLSCEGELDAVITNQFGFPAVTSTAGTHWKDDWYELVVGRRVAVVFDSGSIAAAAARAEMLTAAGAAEAWPVELGLGHGEDLTDFFVTYNRTAADLKRLIRRANKRSRA